MNEDLEGGVIVRRSANRVNELKSRDSRERSSGSDDMQHVQLCATCAVLRVVGYIMDDQPIKLVS